MCQWWVFVVVFFAFSSSISLPYPSPLQRLLPNASVIVADFPTPGQRFTANVISGLQARITPSIFVPEQSYDWFLLNVTLQRFPLMRTKHVTNFVSFLKLTRHLFSSYILCSCDDESVNAALSFASGCSDNTVVSCDPNVTSLLDAASIPRSYDARNWTVLQMVSQFSCKFNSRVSTLQRPQATCCLTDFAVYSRSLHWWTDADMHSSPLVSYALGLLQPLAAVFGWGADEGQTTAALSSVSAFIHASDWARNVPFLSSLPLDGHMTHQEPTPTTPLSSSPKHTVAFLMTDGDNIQWLLQSFISSEWWQSPLRGSFPLGWTLSPALSLLSPMTAHYIASTASSNDSFVAAPSGIGYTNPDIWPTNDHDTSLSQFASLTAQTMRDTMNMTICNIIGQTYSDSASEVMLNENQMEALFWYDYYSYSSENGTIRWINTQSSKKPVIGARFQLWSGTFDNPSQLAAKLNAMPNDPTSEFGYSLVAVHVWTDGVANVSKTISMLQDHVEVVTPVELVKRILKNMS